MKTSIVCYDVYWWQDKRQNARLNYKKKIVSVCISNDQNKSFSVLKYKQHNVVHTVAQLKLPWFKYNISSVTVSWNCLGNVYTTLLCKLGL